MKKIVVVEENGKTLFEIKCSELIENNYELISSSCGSLSFVWQDPVSYFIAVFKLKENGRNEL